MKKPTSFAKKFSLSLLSISCASTVALKVEAETNKQSEIELSKNSVIEDILVTAQKREQNIQEVPISMSVLGGGSLDSGRFQGIAEALSQVAGVTQFTNSFTGGSQIIIRGTAAAAPVFNGSNTVGYYLDEVPFGLIKSAISPDANAYDMERVEVLRGPQGSLYGASALNGVVRILTKDANLDKVEFKARTLLSSTDGGGESHRGDMAFNAPIIPGKLAVRGVVGYNDVGGWIDQPGNNLQEINDGELKSYRLKINAKPTEELKVEFGTWVSRSDFGSSNSTTSDDISVAAGPLSRSVDYEAYGLSITYDFPHFSALSSTSYMQYDNPNFIPIGEGFGSFDTINTADIFTQEVRLTSTLDGPWQWSFGGMYRDAEEELLQKLPAFWAVDFDNITVSESFAVFGEVARTMLDGVLNLTLGLRYFEDDVQSREPIFFGGGLGGSGPKFRQGSTFHNVAPRAVLTWYPRDTLTVYASYSQGFRSGFAQYSSASSIFLPVNEDTLNNYEVGAKGDFLDGHLVYDTALYYIDWQDVQQSLGFLGDAGLVIAAPINGDSASGVGLDFNLKAQATERLQLGVFFSWNDLTMDTDVESGVPGLLLFNKGDRLRASAKYTAGMSGDYTFPMGASGLEGRLSGSVNYVSPLEQRELSGGAIVLTESDRLTTAQLSLSVSSKAWDITLYADNVTNEDGIALRSALADDALTRIRPRAVGLQVEYHY